MTGPSLADARLMLGREVCDLLNISKSTLQVWREDGLVDAVQVPKGGWRYPSNQPLIQRALEALGLCTVGSRS